MLSSLNLKKNSFIRSFINKSYGNAKSSSNKQISEEEALEQYERSKQGKVFMSLIPQLVNDQHSYQVKMSEYNNFKPNRSCQKGITFERNIWKYWGKLLC